MSVLHLINQLSSLSKDATIDHGMNLLNDNLNTVNLSEILKEVKILVQRGKYFKDDSYQHENGYLKLTLLRGQQNGFDFRLNFWHKGIHPSNIHDHRWAFVSKILFGSLVNEIYRSETTRGRTYNHYAYYPRSGNSEYALKDCGLTSLLRESSFILPTSTTYYQESHVIHKTYSYSCAPALSAMITVQRDSIDSTSVYSKNKLNPGEIVSPSEKTSSIVETIDQFSKSLF